MSTLTEVCGIGRLMSYEQAVACCVPCPEEPPNETCEFCGKPIKYKGFMQDGKIDDFFRMSCRCDGGRAQKEKENLQYTRGLMLAGMAAQEIRNMNAWHDGISTKNKAHCFINYRTESKEQHKAKTWCQSFAAHFDDNKGKEKSSLIIYGGCGCGKTHLACAIANDLRENKFKCKFTTFEDLILKIKASYNNEDISDEQIRETYKKVDLLILDDLAKEKATEFSTSVLFDIVNFRYENLLPVLVTSNHDRNSLTERLTPKNGDRTVAEAVVSRLFEMCWELPMDGIGDYRIKK